MTPAQPLRIGVFTAVLCSAALCAQAQTATPGIVRAPEPQASDPAAWLRSPDARQQAWGAWFSGRLLQHENTLLLLALVDQRLGHPGAGDQLAADVALDALIELDAVVPLELIDRISGHRREEALVLLARHPRTEGNDLLLSAMARETGMIWRGAASLALARRARGFAASLLDRLELTARLAVADNGHVGFGGSSLGFTIGCGGTGPPLSGYPPWPSYRLIGAGVAGARLLADGPVPIYYQRSFAGGPGDRRTSSPPVNAFVRLQYAAALLGAKVWELPLSSTPSHTVKWRDHESLASEVESFRAQVFRSHAALVNRLLAAGALTADEARRVPLPLLTIEIDDQRGDRATPLRVSQR